MTNELQAIFKGVSLVEAKLERSGVQYLLPDWPLRRRTDAIATDLTGLGANAERDKQRPAEAYTPDQAWGALYVLEGSRMGARMLCEQVLNSEDTLSIANMRYLTHGRYTSFWRDFLTALDQAADDGLILSAAVEGASDAFGAFEAAFQSPLDRICSRLGT